MPINKLILGDNLEKFIYYGEIWIQSSTFT
jgi:hypothetical protein